MNSTLLETHRTGGHVLPLLPPLLATAFVACAGAKAVGGTAGVWIRLAPLLLLAVVLTHLNVYRPGRLLPLLGPGWEVIWAAGGKISGAFSYIVPLWLVQSGQQTLAAQRKLHCRPWLFPVLFGGIVLLSTVLILLASMMEPQVLNVVQSRAYRMSMLLSNGHSPVFLQFPYVLLWYGSLLASLGFALFAAARLAHMSFPRLAFGWVVWGCALAAALIGGFQLAEQPIAQRLAPFQAFLTGAPLVAAALIGWIRKGAKTCASSNSQ